MVRRRMVCRGMIFVLLAGLVGGCLKREPILALVGEEVITLKDFEQDFSRGKREEQLESVELSALKEHLDQMIGQRLKILTAYKAGLDKDSTLIETIVKPTYHKHLLQRLYDTEIIDPVVKESHIRDIYARRKKEVVIRIIFFKRSSSAGPEEEEKVKKKAEEALQRIGSGEDFEALAREVSEDKTTAIKGGLMAPLEWTRSDDLIRRAAFVMRVGEVSDLIKNNAGYNIIKVEEIRDKERKPYNEVRDEIRRQLAGENREILYKKAREYWEKIMIRNRFQWDEDGLASLMERMKPAESLRKDVLLDSLERLSSEEKETVLLLYSRGKITIGEFQEKLQPLPVYGHIKVNNPDELKNLIERCVMDRLIEEVAVKKGLDKDPRVIAEVRKAKEQEMVRMITEQIHKEEIQPTEEEIMAYYEEHKQDKFSEPERAKIQEVMVRDKRIAEQIYKWVEEGRNMDELAEKYTKRTAYKRKKGILDYFPRGTRGVMGKTAFTLKIGEIAGPIELENNEGYSVIKLLDKKPMKIKPFEKVQEHVARDLKANLKKKRETSWLAEKRKEFRVKVFEKVLKKCFS